MMMKSQFLLIVSILCCRSAVAISINDYCISKTTPEQFRLEVLNDSEEYAYTTSISSDGIIFKEEGKKYRINHNDHGVQIETESGQLISSSNFPITEDWFEEEGAKDIYLTKDNWVFVHTDWNNYMAKLDRSKLMLKNLTKLPAIYKRKCNKLDFWFFGCYVSSLHYSPKADRIFISGYNAISEDYKPIVNEFINGEANVLSTPELITSISYFPQLNSFIFKGKKGEILFYDGVNVREIKTPEPIDRALRYIPKLNSVLLQGTKGAILLFDGTNIKEIASAFPKQAKAMRDWYLAEVVIFEKDGRNNNHDRILLTNFGIDETSHLFMELKSDLSLEPIPFPKQINGTEITLVQFPDDSLLWAMLSSDSILAEIDGKFKSVVTVSKSNRISWKRPLTVPISFEVRHGLGNVVEKESTKYYIKKVSPSANCEVMLDSDNPVELIVD